MNSPQKVYIIFLLVFSTNFSLSSEIDDYFKEDMNTYRLKGLIEPMHYNINLKVFLTDKIPIEQFTFDGKISILLKTWKSNINEIILYKRQLNINNNLIVLVNTNTNEQFKIIEVKTNSTTEKYGIVFEKSMEPGIIYNLKMEFIGMLSTDMIGFYRSSYKDQNGDIRWLATTQLNDKHARRAFPCFDEPKFKTTFNITLNYEKGFNAISNTKQLGTIPTDDGSRLETAFQTTPKMSTYLVAFLISEFEERTTAENNFTIATHSDLISYTEYSLEIGPKLLEKLNEYFQIDYNDLGIKKMHMAAIPDFAAGAMENWGLVLFREKYLLYDSETTPVIDQQRIATVIAHEQSHMWFGNLITLEWWNHLWVNEGFARYFEYFIPDKIYPEWELEKQFITQQVHAAMLVDAMEGTGPMTIYESNTKPYNPPKEFSTISYNKGASIIRMFKYCMGENSFRRALLNLLKERRFTYAAPENVLANFRTEWTHKNVSFIQFFTDWTEQPGYPVVHVSIDEDGKNIEIKQRRFILDSDLNKPELNPNLTYMIPITFTTNIEKNFTIPNNNEVIFINSLQPVSKIQISSKPIKWIILNIQQIGYYRVNYEEKIWWNIQEFLNKSHSEIHEINRANIIDDLFNFARSGLLKYQFIFKILEYLQHETDYLPWTAALSGYSHLKKRMGAEYYKDLNELLLKLLKKAYKKYGFEEAKSDTRLDVYIRSNILDYVCKCGHKECIKESMELFMKKMEHNVLINKNIRNTIFCTALRNGNASHQNAIFAYVQNTFKKNKNPTEKYSILGALGCVSSDENIKNHFEFIISSDEIRLQDKIFALNSLISENAHRVHYILHLVGENLKRLGKSLIGGESAVLSVVSNIATYFTEKSDIKILEDFITSSKWYFSESKYTALNEIPITVKINVEWKKLHKDDFEKSVRGNATKILCNSILTLLYFFYYSI